MDDVVVERVLRAVEQVPPGRVVAYGDIAALVGIGPRQVGAVMSTYGSNVSWWRVTNASGQLPTHLMGDALVRWAAEGILPTRGGTACSITAHRADLALLERDYRVAVRDLDESEQRRL